MRLFKIIVAFLRLSQSMENLSLEDVVLSLVLKILRSFSIGLVLINIKSRLLIFLAIMKLFRLRVILVDMVDFFLASGRVAEVLEQLSG